MSNTSLSNCSKLLSIASPSGYTDSVVRYCSEELQRLGLKPELTRRGAIRAIRPGSRANRRRGRSFPTSIR